MATAAVGAAVIVERTKKTLKGAELLLKRQLKHPKNSTLMKGG